jgi:hypothetical protein
MVTATETTGVAAVDSLVVWSIAAVAIAGLAALLWRIGRAVWRVVRRVDEIADDWAGTPARPGVPARPGLLERVTAIESGQAGMADCLDGIGRRVQRIEHEVMPNGSASMRDAVDRVDRRTARLTPEGEE